MSKQLLLGDEAIAQAALDAGLSGVYAYPGTPSTEITEYIQMAPITTEQNIHTVGAPMKKQRWKLRWVCHSLVNGH